MSVLKIVLFTCSVHKYLFTR